MEQPCSACAAPLVRYHVNFKQARHFSCFESWALHIGTQEICTIQSMYVFPNACTYSRENRAIILLVTVRCGIDESFGTIAGKNDLFDLRWILQTNSNRSPLCQCIRRVICRHLPLPPITVGGIPPTNLTVRDRKLPDKEQDVADLIR